MEHFKQKFVQDLKKKTKNRIAAHSVQIHSPIYLRCKYIKELILGRYFTADHSVQSHLPIHLGCKYIQEFTPGRYCTFQNL